MHVPRFRRRRRRRRAHRVSQLLAALRGAGSTTFPPTPMGGLPALHRGEVIEIQGPASSGKTHLLYHILLSFLVPVSHLAAVVYDTDAAFDVQRFRHLLISRMSRTPPSSSPLDTHESVRRALARLHVFRPTSLVQLAASIANLPAYHSSQMPNQEVAVLAIDSISSFYWLDRLSAEQLRDIAAHGVPMVPSLHHVWDALQRVQRSHRPLAVLTSWALHPAPSPDKHRLRPFPAAVSEDRIPDLGAKTSSAHPSSFPFRLAHHITLSFPSSDPSSAPPLHGALRCDACHSKDVAGDGQVLCLARSFRTRDTAHFIFQITDGDTLIHPRQSTDSCHSATSYSE